MTKQEKEQVQQLLKESAEHGLAGRLAQAIVAAREAHALGPSDSTCRRLHALSERAACLKVETVKINVTLEG